MSTRREAGNFPLHPSPLRPGEGLGEGKGTTPLSVRLGSFCVTLALALLFSLATGGRAAEAPSAGITEPFLDVTLSASVPGIITVQKLKEGDFVKEGDILVELDKTLEELETARRKLVRDQKRSDFDGTQKLFASTKGISKEDVEKKEVEYKVAAVEHDMATEQLRRRQILSPLSGTITEVLLEVGEACQPYQPLMRVVDTRKGYFVTNIDARTAARLKPGQTMKLEIETGSGPAVVQGQITLLSPVVDPASGLQKVKLLFDNANGRIQPGVSGKLFFE
jgi:RND family efflux transporter MFP subunit